MRSLVVSAAAVSALSALAGCLQSAPDDPAEGRRALLDAAMESLAAQRDAEGLWPAGLVPYVAEAAAAARLDLHGWLQPVPVAEQVAWPAEDAPLIAALRPLHAAALAADGDEATLERVRQRVMAGFDGRQFGDPHLLNDDAFALVVLGAAQAAGSADLAPAVDHLLASQAADGGWSWAVDGHGETDMTGIVLRGLAEAGAIHRVDAAAVLAFLDGTRSPGGGYASSAGGEPNCDSTVWGIRARESIAAAVDPESWTFLFGLQTASGEGYGYAYAPGGPANALCTAEVATLLGLLVDHRVRFPPGLDQPDG